MIVTAGTALAVVPRRAMFGTEVLDAAVSEKSDAGELRKDLDAKAAKSAAPQRPRNVSCAAFTVVQ